VGVYRDMSFYPVPAYAVEELLWLGMGPWVFNIMGLFVLLTLAVPALIWLGQPPSAAATVLNSRGLVLIALRGPLQPHVPAAGAPNGPPTFP